MNIVYASDDGYCRHMAVSIISLIEHNKEEALHFHILSDGISEENRALLRQEIEDEGKTLSFYELSEHLLRLRERVRGMDTGRFRPIILARLLMGSILPGTVTKALYLDSDTVVLRSLHSLYAMRLGRYVAAMAEEPTIYPELPVLLGLRGAYYNSGVLLVNLSLWREREIEACCFSYYDSIGGKLPFADQDILNHVLRGQVLRLPQRYNFFSNYYYFRHSALLALRPDYGESRASFQLAKRHPAIVHFAGEERPWRLGNRNHYRRAYELYLRKTPFSAAKKEKGRLLYLQLYHGMNVLSFFFPALRRRISGLYYERFVKKAMPDSGKRER